MQREGQARQGCLKRVCPKFRKDAKQIKHTQTLTLRKASGIVQMQNHISTQTIAVRKVIGIVWKISLMVRMGNNPSGSRPNFFGRQHLTFDKGGKCDSALA